MRTARPRIFNRILTVLALVLTLSSTDFGAVLAEAPRAQNPTPAVQLPAGSPNPDKVFFPNFGQFVANPLLRYWRANGRQEVFGGPMSRVSVNAKGHTIQYFQKFALGYQPELAGTGWETRPYDIGRQYMEIQPAAVRTAFPYLRVPTIANTPQRRYFAETGHTLSFGFYELYQRTGQLFNWGFPLTEEFLYQKDGLNYNAQLFERGRMLWSPTTGAIVDPNFGTEMAGYLQANVAVDFNPEPTPGQTGIPSYNTVVWEHWVDVNLSTNSETFYEGDVPVRTNLVTPGKAGYETPTGTYYVLRRVYNEHMRGGEIGTEDFYDLDNVLYTQYFTWEGHALHYAWWRSYFGIPGSHGCVNQDYASSEFAWNWLSLGSRIQIHY